MNPVDAECGMTGFHSGYLREIFKCAAMYEINPLKLIENYAKEDQIGMNLRLLEEIAMTLPKDMESGKIIKFSDYFK